MHLRFAFAFRTHLFWGMHFFIFCLRNRKRLRQSLSRKLMRFDVNTDALWPKGLREGGNGFFGIETEHKLHVERPPTGQIRATLLA